MQKPAPGDHELRERYPVVIQYHRLRMVQDAMLSGFELRLYSPNELAFAYWYTLGPVRAQQEIVDELKCAVKDRSNGKRVNLTEQCSKFDGPARQRWNTSAINPIFWRPCRGY
jgi:hypothetical protein